MNLEEIYAHRMAAKSAAEQAKYDKQVKIRDERVALAQKFLDKIIFLNKYGYKWELFTSCNMGSDCCMPYYGWHVLILNRTIATSPFESIIVREIDGEIKGMWEPTILGHGRHVEGQVNGWFTAEQLIMELSK